MSNDNVIDDRIAASLRSLRPDRWNRWIEAGRRGQEQAKVLRLLIKASKELPYFTRLSHFVQACVEKSGISTTQASQSLGIDLGENCQAMDEASFSTLEAAELLQLDRKYVRLALLLASLPAEEAIVDGPTTKKLSTIDAMNQELEFREAKHRAALGSLYNKTVDTLRNHLVANGG